MLLKLTIILNIVIPTENKFEKRAKNNPKNVL